MAKRRIVDAIRAGVPAYNAGQIALCEQLYEEAATGLLQTSRMELEPEVAQDLEDTLARAVASRTRSDRPESETDQLAWAFRRAFDKHLSKKAPAQSAQTSITTIVSQTVRQGTSVYNRGDAAECARIYMKACREILQHPSLQVSSKKMLNRSVQQCTNLPDDDSRAWALRRTLDALLGGQAADYQSMPSPNRGSMANNDDRVLCDFVRNSGVSVETSVVNDTVMGGKSDSQVRRTNVGIVFQGVVTRRSGGGFASIRFTPADSATFTQALRSGSGLALVVSCNRGSLEWKVQLNENRGWLSFVGTNWQADFLASRSATRIAIPFAELIPTRYGKPVGNSGVPDDTFENIESFGFMISFLTANGTNSTIFREGPFSFCVESMAIY